MKCKRCGNECTVSHCENCKGLPKLDTNAEQIEQKVHDIDHWIADAIQFREEVLDKLETLMRSFPKHQELRGTKAMAYSYWAAHIKSGLADSSYHNPIATTIASTIKGLLDDIGVDYPSDVDIFDFNYDVEKIIQQNIEASEQE